MNTYGILRRSHFCRIHIVPLVFFMAESPNHRGAFAGEPPVSFEDVSELIVFETRSWEVGGNGLNGVAWFDYDNDEFLDLFLTNGCSQKKRPVPQQRRRNIHERRRRGGC